MQDVLEREAIENEVNTDVKHYLTIYGRIPECGMMVSFRRTGKTRSYGRKIVKCPYCSAHLTDTSVNTRVDILTVSVTSTVQCTLHINCNTCRRDVGINIIIPVY